MSTYKQPVSQYFATVAAAQAAAQAQLQFDSVSSSSLFAYSDVNSMATIDGLPPNYHQQMMKLYSSRVNQHQQQHHHTLAAQGQHQQNMHPRPCHTQSNNNNSPVDSLPSYNEWNQCVGSYNSAQVAQAMNGSKVAAGALGPQHTLDQFGILVRKECMNEIDQACIDLNISADPYNWTAQHVAKWLRWMQRYISLPPFNLDNLLMDGMSLCSLTEDDFKALVPNGEKLFAKLEIWRMAVNYFQSTDNLLDQIFGSSESSDVSSQDHVTYGGHQVPPPAYNSCGSPYSTAGSVDSVACSSPSSSYGSPISPEGYGVANNSSTISSPAHAQSIYSGNGSDFYGSPAPASPAGSCHSVMTCTTSASSLSQSPQSIASSPVHQYHGYPMAPSSTNQQMYNGAQVGALESTGVMQHQQHQLATSDYGSDALPSDDDEMSDDGCIVDYHQQHQQQQQQQVLQRMMNSSPVSSVSSSPSPVAIPSPYSSAHVQQQHYYQMQNAPRQLPTTQMVQNLIFAPQINQVQQNISISKPTPVVPATPTPAITTSATVPPTRTSSSSHIHLWQFLKELLSQPNQFGSSIRWLDRSKGVFKIEDSVRVAKLWGARKNRPAMNYDKLSRSIRQYYKKGIMKKTERSQRLVYQFCTPYSL